MTAAQYIDDFFGGVTSVKLTKRRLAASLAYLAIPLLVITAANADGCAHNLSTGNIKIV